jgi:hypothetical protein
VLLLPAGVAMIVVIAQIATVADATHRDYRERSPVAHVVVFVGVLR